MSRVKFTILVLFGLYSCLTSAAFIKQSTVFHSDLKKEGRIVGGSQTTIEKYPYQVSVRLDTYILLHICGGSIYSPKVIITAAHCIKGRFASYIYVVSGSSTIADESEQGIRASKLLYHPGYNKKTHENDVGLIILMNELTYSNTVQPIALALDHAKAGMHAIVTGWGKNDETAETLTSNLQEVSVQIFDADDCFNRYNENNYRITEEMVCAGVEEGGKDACQGDSGGPLAVDGVLVGIVSWGNGCARSEFPGVYAAVAYHMEWIEDTAQPYLN